MSTHILVYYLNFGEQWNLTNQARLINFLYYRIKYIYENVCSAKLQQKDNCITVRAQVYTTKHNT